MAKNAIQPEPGPNPAPVPAPAVLKATDLIKKAVAGVPALTEEEESLKLVFGIYAQCVVPKMEKKKAAGFLTAFFQVKPADVQRAVVRLNKVILTSSQAIAEETSSTMGIEIDPRTLDIAKRSEEEVEEQNALNNQADQAIASVSTIVNALGLNDLYAQELASQNKKPRKSLTAAIVKKAVETGWLASSDGRGADMQPEELGWNTPPVFDMNDPEVARLLAKLDGVLTMISDNTGSPTLKEQVLAQLENFGVNTADLEQTLYKVSKLAHEQLDQSSKILDRVKSDQGGLAKKIEAVNFVKGVYAAVLTYFFPEYSLKESK